jgi:hypothetical protein
MAAHDPFVDIEYKDFMDRLKDDPRALLRLKPEQHSLLANEAKTYIRAALDLKSEWGLQGSQARTPPERLLKKPDESRTLFAPLVASAGVRVHGAWIEVFRKGREPLA